MAKFTVKDFRKLYPTEEACLDKIFTWRYGKLEACPKCQCEASFRRITTRRCYQCTECYEQFYPTAGTVFEKTRTPLQDWFYIIFLFVTTRNGVAAKEIERQLGVTYKTAWRMGHQIRALLAGLSTEQMQGIVEMDESFVGGVRKNMRKSKRKELMKAGAGYTHQTMVVGMLERGAGVRAKVVIPAKPTMQLLHGMIQENVSAGSTVVTDGHGGYRNMPVEYKHEVVEHAKNEYARGNFHTNSIEGFWSQVKRTIRGTHIAVSPKYLQNYVNECAFRYNNRGAKNYMFNQILEKLPVVN
jgi:transposase